MLHVHSWYVGQMKAVLNFQHTLPLSYQPLVQIHDPNLNLLAKVMKGLAECAKYVAT